MSRRLTLLWPFILVAALCTFQFGANLYNGSLDLSMAHEGKKDFQLYLGLASVRSSLNPALLSMMLLCGALLRVIGVLSGQLRM